jgi:acetyl-CoA synthetase (ADP-forming)
MNVQDSTSVDALLETARELIAKKRGKTVLLEHEVKGLLKTIGLPVPSGVFVRKKDISSLPKVSYPVVAKVSSGKIPSKSDVRGIRMNIKNDDELQKAFDELGQIEYAEGILVETMAPQGIEVIVGGIVDTQFGPVVMFGLGGIFVELFKDVAFGLAPITKEDALRMIKQVKGYRVIEGYRGRPPADIKALLHIIVSVSELMAAGPIEEIDLNPVTLYPDSAMILDAKLSLRP